MPTGGGRSVYTKEQRRLAHEEFLQDVSKARGKLLEALDAPSATWSEKVSAAKEILNRALGQAPTFQNIQIEDSRNDKPLIGEEALRALTSEELEQWARLAKKIVSADEDIVEGQAITYEDDA